MPSNEALEAKHRARRNPNADCTPPRMPCSNGTPFGRAEPAQTLSFTGALALPAGLGVGCPGRRTPSRVFGVIECRGVELETGWSIGSLSGKEPENEPN